MSLLFRQPASFRRGTKVARWIALVRRYARSASTSLYHMGVATKIIDVLGTHQALAGCLMVACSSSPWTISKSWFLMVMQCAPGQGVRTSRRPCATTWWWINLAAPTSVTLDSICIRVSHHAHKLNPDRRRRQPERGCQWSTLSKWHGYNARPKNTGRG